jgi:hypothetical protein
VATARASDEKCASIVTSAPPHHGESGTFADSCIWGGKKSLLHGRPSVSASFVISN